MRLYELPLATTFERVLKGAEVSLADSERLPISLVLAAVQKSSPSIAELMAEARASGSQSIEMDETPASSAESHITVGLVADELHRAGATRVHEEHFLLALIRDETPEGGREWLRTNGFNVDLLRTLLYRRLAASLAEGSMQDSRIRDDTSSFRAAKPTNGRFNLIQISELAGLFAGVAAIWLFWNRKHRERKS